MMFALPECETIQGYMFFCVEIFRVSRPVNITFMYMLGCTFLSKTGPEVQQA